MDPRRIVQVGFHERQDFAAIVVWIGLVGDAAIVGEADAPAVIAAGAGRERDRQQQDRHMLRNLPQDAEPVIVPARKLAAPWANWNSHLRHQQTPARRHWGSNGDGPDVRKDGGGGNVDWAARPSDQLQPRLAGATCLIATFGVWCVFSTCFLWWRL